MSPVSVSLGSQGPRAQVNREGKVSAWDPALETLWGRAAAQALGRKLDQLLVALEPTEWPDFDSVPRTGWSGIVALIPTNGNAPRPTGIRLTKTAAGDSLEVHLAPLSCLAAESATTDAPVDAERDLQRFAAMLEFMPGYCYTVDRELTFTSSAGRGLGALSLRPGQVIGMNLRDLWGTREDTYQPFVCHLKALAGIPSNYTDVCLGRSLEYLIRPLRDAEGNVVGAIGVGVDVTELEHARGAHAALTEQLRQAQKMEAIGRLAGGIAHDFNNFLTCIMGNLSLLEGHFASHGKTNGGAGKEAEATAFLAEANAAVDSAASLTRQLLAFSRKQVLNPRPIQLSSLIERIGKILERLVGARIALHLRCDPELWNVQADAGQLEQVLVNLVLNARDAISEEGQVVIETRNVVLQEPAGEPHKPLPPGEYVELCVRDSGRGLSDVVRTRLFEPFFTTKDVGEGTGLGLATVYGAVQQNGGAITVESELGSGSTFRILLPRVAASSSSEVAAAGRTAPAALVGGKETILLVEDEPSVLDLAHRTLQQLGYNVLPCASPDEALRTFGEYQSRIELLVTDVVMPRMNGNELAARVTALSPGVSVLFSSGYGESVVARRGVAPHFISKPYRPRELATKVRALLDQRHA
ncbi:MAG TPA: ATP-binding protein [Polyangiaceae bacterium]|nr:ATP-binding protein [Polyangiaceae bacterium]